MLDRILEWILMRIDSDFRSYDCKSCGEHVFVIALGTGSRLMTESGSCQQCFFGPKRPKAQS